MNPSAGAHPALIQAIATILSHMTINTGDMLTIYQLYTGATPPPVDFLHHASFLDLLVTALFYHKSDLAPEPRQRAVFVLAYAVSTSSVPVSTGGGVTVSTGGGVTDGSSALEREVTALAISTVRMCANICG